MEYPLIFLFICMGRNHEMSQLFGWDVSNCPQVHTSKHFQPLSVQRLQGFGTSANQGYGGETSAAPSEANPSLANGSHEIPQIRGHVNVSMAHLQQEQQMPKLETDAQQLTQQVPTNTQPSQQPNQLDQSMTYHQQQPPPQQQQQQQQQPGASQTSGESMNMKKYYDNDEDEDTIIDEHFNKSFASESRTRCKFFKA